MAHVLSSACRNAAATVQVRSGGIGNHARDGMIPSLDARLVLREAGIHLAEDAFASTDLRRNRQVVAEADLILTMTAEQKTAILAFEEAGGRLIYTLKEFAGASGDIRDPYGADENRYRACRDEIRQCLERSLPRLLDSQEDER
jgi:protein-tyrosine phosphatase